jgi:DNA polymerase-1
MIFIEHQRGHQRYSSKELLIAAFPHLSLRVSSPIIHSQMTNEPTERVFLIDAMSHIFRAFFAPMGVRAEPLRTSQGQPTQAVFVFTNMLRKLLHDEKPHYIAAVFDSAEKTFRHESFEAYKANRAEMPDELASQLPYITRVCEVFRIPILKMSGYEADDIIGTLANKAAEKNLKAVIVSNDKDMCQLVRDPHIVCMRQNSQNIKRKVPVPPIEWCDEAWVENKFGVPPNKIIELLGLMGDSIDNIPGAPGIGEKGALQIVKQFGSIEEALKRYEEVKHKTYRESLQNNADLIRQSLELATIKTDVPIDLDLEQLKHEEPDRPAAYQLFRELEFQALIREFSDAASSAQTASALDIPRRYKIIKARNELDKLVRTLWEAEHWAFAVAGLSSSETEQASLFTEPKTPSGIAIATAAGVSYYIDLENFEGGKENAITPLRDILANGLLEKATHDLKRAISLLETLYIEPEGVTDDTLLAAYLLDSTRSEYPISFYAREAIGVDETNEAEEGWSLDQWRVAETADFTAQVAPILRKRLQEQNLEKIYLEMEMPLTPLLHRIEKAGMRVDTNVLKDLSKYFGDELEKLTKRIYEVAGREFKINSPKQVGEVLEELNISTGRKTSTGRISTSKDVLQELAETYELPRLIIEYRELDKLKSVYTDVLPNQIGADGRIHGQLNQTVAATGRLSCLPAGTLVNTERGLIGIESAQVGELINTPFGAYRITAWQATGQKPVVRLELSNGIVLRCSSEHRLRSRGEWVEAQRIEVGDPVYMSFTKGLFGKQSELNLKLSAAYTTRKTPMLPQKWTPEFAEFVGYCMADGHIVRSNYNNKPDKIVLAFGWDDDELIVHFSKIIRRIFGKEPTRRVTKSCLILDVSGVDIAGALVQLGAGGKSGEIRVPPSIYHAPEEIVAAFLRGYFEGDGCVLADGGLLSVRSVSRAMLCDVQQLLTLFGIPSKICDGYPDPRGYAPRFTLRVMGDRSKITFEKLIGFLSRKKQQTCVNLLRKDRKKSCAEIITLPSDFNIHEFKSALYDANRGDNGRVPMPLMVFASKYTAQGVLTISLPRAEWILQSLKTQTNTLVENQCHSLRFLQEAVDSQLYEIHIASISNESSVPMYDIAVEGVEQYLAQGIVVHNSTNPNLQNIPIRTELGQRIRRAFIPADGCKFVSADYSQLELRILAHVTHDEVMMDAFQKGEDIHTRTARLVFNAQTEEEMKEKRRLAKIVNFGIAYAVEAYGLSQRVGITFQEAKKVIEDYYATYKGVRRYMEEIPEKAREQGYVASIFGRRRYFPSINDRNFNVRSRAEREAINMPIQGTASDIVKIAMLRVDEALRREKLKAQMIMQVHDELLIEAPNDEAIKVAELLKREMESAVTLDVPLVVEVAVGTNWMDAK